MNTQVTVMSRKNWLMLLAFAILVLFVNIDYTAINLALVAIAEEVQVELNSLQWLLSAYILAWSAAVIPAGRLADTLGKRRMLLWGIYLFTGASVLCGFANSIEWLVIGRIIQGIGGALFCPPIYALTFQSVPPSKQGLAIGMIGVGAGIGLAIGPSFGGLLIEYMGWRWIFFVNVPLAILTVITLLYSTEDERPKNKARLDYLGVILLASYLGSFMYVVNQAEIWGITQFKFWGALIACQLFLLGFLVWSKLRTEPLIPTKVFKNPTFLACAVGFGLFELIFMIILVLAALYLQNVQGYTAFQSGIIFFAMTLSMGFLSPFGGKMVDTVDARYPICGGFLLMLLGLWFATQFSAETIGLGPVLLSFFLFGTGAGLVLPSCNAAMMKAIDPDVISTGSSVFTMIATLCATIGVILTTNLLVGLGEPTLLSVIQQAGANLDTEQLQMLVQLISSATRTQTELDVFAPEQLKTLIGYLNQAYVIAMTKILWIGIVLCAICCWFSWKWIDIKPNRTN